MSQYTITGFDACSHMSEETRGADTAAPVAIVLAMCAHKAQLPGLCLLEMRQSAAPMAIMLAMCAHCRLTACQQA